MPNAASLIVHATDDTFAEEVERSSGLTIVDFWATWCGPCHMIAPSLEQIATERAGTVRVVKVNADENQRTTARFGVRSLPTLLFFKDGTPVGQVVGAVPKPHIDQAIERFA
jgi:thioredoxin 1